jgi:hypothetical protein
MRSNGVGDVLREFNQPHSHLVVWLFESARRRKLADSGLRTIRIHLADLFPASHWSGELRLPKFLPRHQKSVYWIIEISTVEEVQEKEREMVLEGRLLSKPGY